MIVLTLGQIVKMKITWNSALLLFSLLVHCLVYIAMSLDFGMSTNTCCNAMLNNLKTSHVHTLCVCKWMQKTYRNIGPAGHALFAQARLVKETY